MNPLFNRHEIETWLQSNPLSPEHVDCATAVMLKILDGKCKMNPAEKVVMALLYDAVKNLPGKRLDADIHRVIGDAEGSLDETMKNFIYERRVLAETVISRPVMKAFKTMIRARGLFERFPDRSAYDDP